MANETSSFQSNDHDQLLQDLRSDRQGMAARLSGPWWLAPGFGLVAAAYVATAIVPSGPWRDAVLIAAVAATIAILSAYRTTTGIKLSRLGGRAVIIQLSAAALTLFMLSVTYGLAASPFIWWTPASILLTFVAVTWLTKRFIAAVRERVNHGI